MGQCVSLDPLTSQQTRDINRIQKIDQKIAESKIPMLLIGTGESGMFVVLALINDPNFGVFFWCRSCVFVFAR